MINEKQVGRKHSRIITHLTLLLGLLLDIGYLLPLLRGSTDLHSQNDVAHFRLSKRSHIYVVLLPVVVENLKYTTLRLKLKWVPSERAYHILESELHLDPLLVRKCRPYMVRLSDRGPIWLQYHLRLVRIDVHSSHYQDHSRERGVARNRLKT